MLNKLFFIAFAAICLQSCCAYADSQGGRPGIKWLTNYEEAVQQSKAASKPIVLFFTGSDWCGWCTKLDEETFDTPEFAEVAGTKFIFVKLDFPLYIVQEPSLKAQNKELQQKFDVRSFPTLIILDAQLNQQIGTTGYRPGGGKAFAEHLNKMVSGFSTYKQKISTLEKAPMLEKVPMSGCELKQLYDKSKELRLSSDTSMIVKKGMNSDETLYFLTERYRYLADEGQINSKEAVGLRQQIVAADPQNLRRAHYQIALIEFQARCGELEKDNNQPELATAPLVTYIEKFGKSDKENAWRLKIIISQVYLDRNQMTTALKYAQESYDSAPSCVQPELARAIQNIRSQIHSSR